MARKKYSQEHKRWSLAIRTRANHTCEVCSKTDCKIDAHHILPREVYKAYQYDLNNGIALCFRCHKLLAHLSGVEFGIWLEAIKPAVFQWVKNSLLTKKENGVGDLY